MQAKDYYTILGIARDADEEEIKKSYRRLALRYHPDTNEGDPEREELFKEINEAYSVLGDREKRRRYDARGRIPFDRPDGGRDPFETWFSQSMRTFGGGGPCRGWGRGMGRGFGRRGCGMGRFFKDPFFSFEGAFFEHRAEPAVHELPLTSAEARSGAEKEVLLSTEGATQRLTLRIPPGLEDGAMLFMRGEDLGLGGQDVYFRISLVD
ncbi:MAG: DnaJ domain-containing protein [Deltaproteobacteria bacterium]|nr:DnaJ domain-containing protein [Deltaproteobacteria bacterium]